MIVSILLIYCIIMCWWCYSWVKKKFRFKIRTNKQLILNILVVTLFFVVFVVFLRVLNLFRESKVLDLNIISTANDVNTTKLSTLLLIVLLLYSLRRLVVYCFKIMWFRLHYFLLSKYNLPKVYKIYTYVYTEYVYTLGEKMFKYLKIINALGVLGLIIIICFDIIFNSFILDLSLVYLRYYSLFKLVYLVSKFMSEKQVLILDYYSFNTMYSGVIDKNMFHVIMCPKHRKLIGQAFDYCDGVILEYKNYVAKKIDYDNEYLRYFKIVGSNELKFKIVSIDEILDVSEKKN
ncbi:hypothetical protein EON71_00585 [bacterium]|nr:MAG: hypothetical protein EON71_00585 [bacterium]